MDFPKLSIITINRNNRDGLRKTIESVESQTFRDFEYIVIDGASTDGSTEVIKQYEDKITYWVSEADTGIYNAMNKGIVKATGEYCLFLNSGDYLYDNEVLRNFLILENHEDIVYGNLMIDWGNKKQLGLSPERISLTHMLKDTLWHPVSFIKRELFERIGYYSESYIIAGDYEFFLRALFVNNCSYKHINNIVAVFDTFGLSSRKENKEIMKNERILAQNANIKYEILEIFNELNNELTEVKLNNELLKNSNESLKLSYDILNKSRAIKLARFIRNFYKFKCPFY